MHTTCALFCTLRRGLVPCGSPMFPLLHLSPQLLILFEHENSQATPFTRVTVKDISSRLGREEPIRSVFFHASSALSQSSHAKFCTYWGLPTSACDSDDSGKATRHGLPEVRQRKGVEWTHWASSHEQDLRWASVTSLVTSWTWIRQTDHIGSCCIVLDHVGSASHSFAPFIPSKEQKPDQSQSSQRSTDYLH